MAEFLFYLGSYGAFFGDNSNTLTDPDEGVLDGAAEGPLVTDGAITVGSLALLDTDASHKLSLVWNEDDSADRTFNLLVGGGNRSVTINENFTIGDGTAVTITSVTQANTFTMNESFTIGDGHTGTLTFSAASKVATIEDTFIGNNSAYVDGPLSPQVLTGCTIEAGTNAGTAKVLAGTVLLRTTTSDPDDTGVLRKYSVSETDNLVLTNADTNYFVQIQWNSGSPIAAISATTANGQTNINIGRAMRESDNTFHYINGGYRLANGLAKAHHRAAHLRGWEMSKNIEIGDNADKSFTIAGGEFFRGLTATTFSTWDSSGASRFTYVLYYDGAWRYEATQQYIDVDNYNDVTDAVDGKATCNKYKCDWVFVHPTDGHVYVVYGQTDGTISAIEDSSLPSGIPDLVDTFGMLIGRIIVDGGDTAFHRIEMLRVEFAPGVTVEHNDLSAMDGGTAGEYYHTTLAQHTVITQAATDALNGYMTSTYAAKLDGIDAGATDDQSEAEVLTLLGLTAVEVDQVGNIAATTISEAQWGYLGGATANGGALIDAANYAAMMALLSGTATAAFAFNSQNLTGVGTIGCNEITVADGHGINLQEDITFTGASGVNLIKFPDNLANALSFKEGTNSYLKFVATNGSMAVVINEDGLDHDFRIETTASANSFYINGDAGNIGIGTATPSAAANLHLIGASWAQMIFEGTTSFATFYMRDGGANENEKVFGFRSQAGDLKIGTQTDAYSAFSAKMTLDRSGNVNINDHDGATVGLELGGNLFAVTTDGTDTTVVGALNITGLAGADPATHKAVYYNTTTKSLFYDNT